MKKILLISLIFLSCNKNLNKEKKWAGQGFIKKEGKYEVKQGYDILVEQKKSLVNIEIVKDQYEKVFELEHEFSSVHKWYLFYDGNLLWVYSSDIGSSYITINDLPIKQVIIRPNSLDKAKIKIPKEIEKDILDI